MSRMNKLTTKQEQWLTAHTVCKWEFREDGRVDVEGTAFFYEPNYHKLLRMSVCESDAYIKDERANKDMRRKDSVLGVHFNHIEGSFDISRTTISSLRGFPETVGRHLWTHHSRIHSFSGVHKIIKSIGGEVSVNLGATHLLGFVLISDVSGIDAEDETLQRIMNEYVGTGKVIECQDELIDAGYIQQAKL